MNYVKHLSIALLVLGTVSLYAAAPATVVKRYKTTGGTELAYDANKQGAAAYSHPQAATANHARHGVTVVDQNGVLKLEVPGVNNAPATFEDLVEIKGWTDSAKDAFHNWVGKNATHGKRAIVAGVVAALGVVGYKTVPAFKDVCDDAANAISDFAHDVKDGNGNARRNAAIGAGVSAAAVLGGYYYKYGKFPFQA